jgi:serine/threonine-protein kinase
MAFGPDIFLYRGDAHRSGVYDYPAFRTPPDLVWETSINPAYFLAYHDGTLYSGSTSGALYALDAQTGAQRWRVAGFGAALSPIAIAGDAILAGGFNNSIQALNRHTGEALWTFTADGRAMAQPLIIGERAYVPATKTLYALQLETGEILWEAPLGNQREDDYIGGPAFESRTLFLSVGKAVVALDAETGAERWRIEKEMPFNFIAVDDARVYVGNGDGLFYAFEQATGEVAWEFESGAEMWFAPAVTTDTVYVGAFNGFAYALDSTTGEKRWEFDTGQLIVSDMVVSDGLLYFSNCNHELRQPEECRLYAREASTGAPVWEFSMTATQLSTPVLGQDAIYIMLNRSVAALRYP